MNGAGQPRPTPEVVPQLRVCTVNSGCTCVLYTIYKVRYVPSHCSNSLHIAPQFSSALPRVVVSSTISYRTAPPGSNLADQTGTTQPVVGETGEVDYFRMVPLDEPGHSIIWRRKIAKGLALLMGLPSMLIKSYTTTYLTPPITSWSRVHAQRLAEGLGFRSVQPSQRPE
jgi:hypothetical protein